jgi:hypothetical protein
VLVSLAAQSSTENLNSGATTGIARYALWYIPLFFPVGLATVEWSRAALRRKVIVGAALAICAVHNLALNRPQLPQSYGTPSPVSLTIQKYFPSIYDPHWEIFAERYSGAGEEIWRQNPLGVVGPDCRKVLLIHSPAADRVFGGRGCGFDPGRIAAVLKSRLITSATQQRSEYIWLTNDDVAQSKLVCEGKIDLSTSGNLAMVVPGFSEPEHHGRWSDGNYASFNCVIPLDRREATRVARIFAYGFVPGGRRQRLRLTVNHVELPEIEFVLPGEKVIDLKLPNEAAVNVNLRFEFPDAVSPQELGLSSDPRKLGVGIRVIEFL